MFWKKYKTRIVHISIAAVLIVFAIVSFNFAYRITSGAAKDNPPGHTADIIVFDAMSEADVANMLKEKNIINSALEFEIQARIKGYKPSKHTGSFTVNSSMNVEKILSELMNQSEKKQ